MIEANHAQLMNVFTNGQLVKTFVETMNNISEGFKVRKEILPPDAEKKYDMNVQKDISEIQVWIFKESFVIILFAVIVISQGR